MQTAFKKDFNNSYLHILSECLNKKEYQLLKKQLIRSKYYLSFIDKSVEESMFFSEFEIPEMLFFKSENKANYWKLDTKIFNRLKKEYVLDNIMLQFKKMFELSDLDYSEEKIAISTILRQCLMRAGFMLLDDDTISDLNYEFHEYIESNDYLTKHRNDRISSQLIINYFRNVKKDKSQVKVISLKLKPE